MNELMLSRHEATTNLLTLVVRLSYSRFFFKFETIRTFVSWLLEMMIKLDVLNVFQDQLLI